MQLGRSSQSGIVALVVSRYSSRYSSSREFGSLKRFPVSNLRVLKDFPFKPEPSS